MNTIGYKLELFRKIITDFIGHDLVEYVDSEQAYQRQSKKPWIQLECLQTVTESYNDEYEEDETTGEQIPTVTTRQGLLINVHCRSRNLSSFEALYDAIRLQSFFSCADLSTVLENSIGICIREPSEDTEGLPSITMNTAEYKDRVEADYFFPIVLLFGETFRFKELTPGWFNAVLISTEIDGLSSLDLDNERMEGPQE